MGLQSRLERSEGKRWSYLPRAGTPGADLWDWLGRNRNSGSGPSGPMGLVFPRIQSSVSPYNIQAGRADRRRFRLVVHRLCRPSVDETGCPIHRVLCDGWENIHSASVIVLFNLHTSVLSLKFDKELSFGSVTGHDFSRAVNGAKSSGLQPL